MIVLIVTPYYEPDLGPSSPLITVLSEDLVKFGHTVYVITTVPHFPSGYVPNNYRKGLIHWEERKSVKICRIRIPSGNRANLYHRLIVFIIYQVISSFIGYPIKCDVLLITNPALETFLPFYVLRKWGKIPVLNCVWDIYPDAGVHAGIFKNKLVVKFVEVIEKFCLNRSSLIQVFSQPFVTKLCNKGITIQKIKIIQPWMEECYFVENSRINSFSSEYHLNDKFIILHAGNIGYSQDLECLLLAAKLLENDGSYLFVLVGDGPKKGDLIEFSIKLNLNNVRFIPYQMKTRVPEVFASSDISIVSQKKDFGLDSLPSKILHILASKRPVIAVTEFDSSLAELIRMSDSGICISPHDEHLLAQTIEIMRNNPTMRGEFSNNGYNYALGHFHHRQASLLFEKYLISLTG
jgi:colanic acid biosynthesis glycosyl transferase WcaI